MGLITTSDFLRTHANRRPDHLAYIYLDEAVTWFELDRRVNAIAAGLRTRGIRPNDVVAICAHDGPVQIEMLFVAARMGVVRVGLNTRFAQSEIEKLANHANPKLIIVEDELKHLIGDYSPEFGIISAGDGQCLRSDYEDLLDFDTEFTAPPVSDADIAQICYTTGSTGNPKGAIWRHSAIVNAMGFTLLDLGLGEDDVYLHCLPAAGVPSVLATWNVIPGFTNVIMPGFDPELALDLIDKYRCSSTLWVPTMLTAVCVAAEKKPRNVSSMRKILYGSAPSTPALIRRVSKVFDGVDIEQIYGSTEGAGGWYTKLTPADHQRALEDKVELLTSCGRPMIHAQLMVVDDDGHACAPGEVGEICVSGSFMMDGYFKEEELTNQVIDEGWLHTGDMGRIDEEGYLYLVDRKKFMIITGGYNVYPIEVENEIVEHPSVSEACVFGIPDEKWGEAIHAAVVVNEGMKASEEEIIAWCRENLTKFKVPKSVEFRDNLICGATGKVLKRAEQDRYMANHSPSP